MSQLQGPRGAIAYQRDPLGYPTITARDHADAAWARGWFHGHDRLVQTQISLAVARGRALALLGDTPLARLADRMTRLHRFTDDLDDQVAKLSAESRAMVDAYCAGFDAGATARGWPLLLRAAGIPPSAYRPRDLVAMYRIVSWFGLTQLAEMPPLIINELLARGVERDAIGRVLGDAATADELAAAPVAAWPAELAIVVGSPTGGSNAIAVAGARSATGGALLIGDPHMEIARIPPVLYAMHANLPDGEYLSGLGVPGLWWPSFGRTARVAWAYTYGHAQAVDVRVVRCRRGEYFDGVAWRSLARRTTTVTIKKRPAETWTFWDGELGTVVGAADADHETDLPCVRWGGIRATHRDLDGALALIHARDVDGALAANRELRALSLDAVVADASGRIGHLLTGHVDARPASSRGVVARAPDGPPVPADETTRPMTIDPPSGSIVSANARPDEPGGATWVPMPEAHARRDRLRALVAAHAAPLELDDLARFVHDACDAGATRLLAVWAPHLPDDPRARELVAWAAAQPGAGEAHFANLSRWTALHAEVSRAYLRDAIGGAHADRLVDELASLALFQHAIDDALALARPADLDAARLRALLADAFPRAFALAATPEHALPRRERFRHIVLGGKLAWLGFDSKPIEARGGPTTPNQVTAVSLGGQRVVFGAAGRFLCDLSRPGAWYCMAGGASERRLGPGYGAGLAAWSRAEFLPLGASGATPTASRRS